MSPNLNRARELVHALAADNRHVAVREPIDLGRVVDNFEFLHASTDQARARQPLSAGVVGFNCIALLVCDGDGGAVAVESADIKNERVVNRARIGRGVDSEQLDVPRGLVAVVKDATAKSNRDDHCHEDVIHPISVDPVKGGRNRRSKVQVRNSAQLALPFDSADLRTGEVGQLIILSYRGRFVLAIKATNETGVSAIDGDDETLLAIALGVRRAG